MPPLNEVAEISIVAALLTYRPRRDEKLSWPGWLTYSGRFIHIKWSPVSYRWSCAGHGKFDGQRLTFYRAATQPIRNVFQTSDSLTANDEDSLKTSSESDRAVTQDQVRLRGLNRGLGTEVTTNEQYCIRRRLESGVMPLRTALYNHQLLFSHSVHVYIPVSYTHLTLPTILRV